MKLFENQSSESLSKRLDALRGELTAAEEAVSTAEESLEEAIAAGAPSEKALKMLGDSRARAEALRSVIGKAEAALATAKDREARAARLKEILAVEKQGRVKLESLGKQKSSFVTAARDLVAQYSAINQTVRELLELSGGRLPSAASFPEYAFGVVAACTARPPKNTPEDALRQADIGLTSGIVAVAQNFDSAIASGKASCEQ